MNESRDKTGQRNAWGRVPAAYDELWAGRLARYSALGVERLRPAPGGEAVDVACGTGGSTACLAEGVRGGHALGVDFSPEMVAFAARRWADVPGLAFAVDDVERLSLPDRSFDAAASSFGLMYRYEPARALAHMARVLRPGGRLLIVAWGRAGSVWWSPAIELVETRARYFSGVCPMIFFYGLPGVLERMVADAGLEPVSHEVVDEPMRFASVAEAVDAATIGGPLRGLFVNRLSDAERGEVRDELARHVRAGARAADGGVLVPAEVSLTIARSPERGA